MLLDTGQLTPTSLPTPQDRTNNFWYVRRDPNDVIVFLHGIFSSSLTCWLHRAPEPDRSVYWPDLVRTDARFGNASIYMAGYYTELDAGDFPISQCAAQVFAALERTDADGFAPVLNATRIAFVCHSTGGIVARYLIERHQDTFKDKALGLALIASPSLGSRWAGIAGPAARYYNQHLGQQLQWKGDALDDLDGRFKDLISQKPPRLPGLFGMEAAENKMVFRDWIPGKVRWLLPPRWTVVNTLSAGRYFGQVTVLGTTDHFSSVKPTGLNHPAHEFLATFRQRFLQSIPVVGVSSTPPVTETPQERTGSDDLDADDWPAPTSSTAHLFLTVDGFADGSTLGVATCIALDDDDALDRSLSAVLQGWQRDPALREIPGFAEVVRKRDLANATLDTDLRARVIEWLASQLFEAYVCYTHTPGAASRDAAVAALLQDRLVANRNRPISIIVDFALRAERTALDAVVEQARHHAVTAARGAGALDVTVVEATERDPAVIVARLVSQMVRAQLSATSEPERRPFRRIHPQKLRVLHDLDTDTRYTRRKPYGV